MDGNELRLTPIKKGDLKFDLLGDCLADSRPEATIISSSPLLEHDAMYMRIIYERMVNKRVAKNLRAKKKKELEAAAAAAAAAEAEAGSETEGSEEDEGPDTRNPSTPSWRPCARSRAASSRRIWMSSSTASSTATRYSSTVREGPDS